MSLKDTYLWRSYKSVRLENSYRNRSLYYHRRLLSQGIRYSESEVLRKIRKVPAHAVRDMGAVRTLLIVPEIGWHDVLARSLEKIGPLAWYKHEGNRLWCRTNMSARSWVRHRAEFNNEIREMAQKLCKAGGIDWVFCYSDGMHLLRDTVRFLRQDLGLPVVTMSLDDKQSWQLGRLGDQDMGQVDLAKEFDLYWTSARECCNWILAEGGNAIFMPEGCDPEQFRPINSVKDMDIVFVGAAYGFRRSFIHRISGRLLKYKFNISCFGQGWGNKHYLSNDELTRTLNRGWINLGHGGIGHSESLMNLKGRDYETPAIGSAVYLTTFNPELIDSYDIGSEVCCYRSDDDLVEQINGLMSDKDKLLNIASRGRARCIREHTWLHRFSKILEFLGIFKGNAWPISDIYIN